MTTCRMKQNRQAVRVTSKRRKWLVLLIGVAVAAALVIVALQPAGEGPVYKGRHLSEWVELLGTRTPGSTDWIVARNAVQLTGTNAYPYLFKWLPHEEKAWRREIGWKFWPLTSESVEDTSIGWSRAQKRANGVPYALAAISTNASPEVVAQLCRLTNRPTAPQTAARARMILDFMGRQETNAPPR